MYLCQLPLIEELDSSYCTSFFISPQMSEAMRLFSLIFAGLILVSQIFPGKRKVFREAELATGSGSVFGEERSAFTKVPHSFLCPIKVPGQTSHWDFVLSSEIEQRDSLTQIISHRIHLVCFPKNSTKEFELPFTFRSLSWFCNLQPIFSTGLSDCFKIEGSPRGILQTHC